MAASPLILALDTPDVRHIQALVAATAPYVDIYKIGMEAFTAIGPAAVAAVREMGKEVFLDLKFHDIPNTVAGAIRSAAGLGVSMMNVHAVGGRSMMAKARTELDAWSADTGRPRPFLLAVTILTSLEASDLTEVGYGENPVPDIVVKLALLAREAGLCGVVASPRETSLIRKALGPDFLIVTPGIRPSNGERGDQKRTLTPAEAANLGANFVVVGRPVTGSSDPGAAAAAIYQDLCQAERSAVT